MEINWTTFTAQIINFLVLAWLLKRFLYGPIVRAMDKREQKLAERLDEGVFHLRRIVEVVALRPFHQVGGEEIALRV